jgi:hypothetical protein
LLYTSRSFLSAFILPLSPETEELGAALFTSLCGYSSLMGCFQTHLPGHHLDLSAALSPMLAKGQCYRLANHLECRAFSLSSLIFSVLILLFPQWLLWGRKGRFKLEDEKIT